MTDSDLNSYYWTFIDLINQYDDLLSVKGKIIKQIVLSKGEIKGISNLKKYINCNNALLGKKCQELEKDKILLNYKCGSELILNINPKHIEKSNNFIRGLFDNGNEKKH